MADLLQPDSLNPPVAPASSPELAPAEPPVAPETPSSPEGQPERSDAAPEQVPNVETASPEVIPSAAEQVAAQETVERPSVKSSLQEKIENTLASPIARDYVALGQAPGAGAAKQQEFKEKGERLAQEIQGMVLEGNVQWAEKVVPMVHEWLQDLAPTSSDPAYFVAKAKEITAALKASTAQGGGNDLA